MLLDRSRHRPSQRHGHSVSNHTPNDRDADWLARLREGVLAGESLEQRSLPQGQGAILLRMAEASIAETVELRRDGRGGLVPGHASIDREVLTPRSLPVASGYEFGLPVAPSASGPRSLDPLQIEVRHDAGSMDRIAGIGLSCLKGRQMPDHLLDVDIFARPVSRFGQGRFTMPGTDQDKARPSLRDAEVQAVQHIPPNLIAVFFQRSHETLEAPATIEPNQLRHVFHRHDVRTSLYGNPGKIDQQTPLRSAQSPRVRREGLARGASDQNPGRLRREVPSQLRRINLGYVPAHEWRSVVFLKGVPAVFVGVVAAGNGEAFQEKAMRKAPDAAKKVDYRSSRTNPSGGLRRSGWSRDGDGHGGRRQLRPESGTHALHFFIVPLSG